MYIYRQRHSVATTLLTLAISMSGCSMLPSFDNSMTEGKKALSEGQLNRAEQNFQQAISQAESAGKHTHQVAVAKVGLADTYLEQEIIDDAETLYDDALEIEGNESNETTAKIYHGLGRLNLKRQTFALSEKYLKKALAAEQSLEEPNETETAKIYADLAQLYLVKGKPTLAKENFEKSLDILEGLDKKDYDLQAKVMDNLANIAKDDEDLDAAEDYRKRAAQLQLERSKKVMSVLPWVNNPNVAPTANNNAVNAAKEASKNESPQDSNDAEDGDTSKDSTQNSASKTTDD